MGNEIEILELESTIRSRVRSQFDRTQKEVYLREQLRAIQEELGMERPSEADELRAKLKEKELPPEVITKMRKEIDRLERTPPQSAEVTVLRSYIDWVLALPWTERTEDTFDIEMTRRILDEEHYGLENIKERIIEFLAVRQLRLRFAGLYGRPSESQGQILCFIGPPGVGKTSLARSIAHALSRKFARISLGGVHDEAEIRGHRRTYVGALPGRIIQAMKTVGVRNPVFLLDEIDKLSAEYRGDPAAALLEVLDPEQNFNFRDNYLDLPFDLSKVFFIATANALEPIPAPLRDRMEILELSGYTEEQKLHIARQYLLPKQLEANGLKPEELTVTDDALRRIIRDYTREAGVRNLEREIGSLCRKVATQIAEGKQAPIHIEAAQVPEYLGRQRFFEEAAERIDRPGIATGLVWTPVGGEIIFIEAATMPDRETRLTLTGQLGDVMKESAMTALTYVRSNAEMLGLPANVYENQNVHIHVPAGAIPKDGPSAGVTMATVLVSLASGRKVRSDVAMTGEITLRGRVLPIGGVKEKVLAAYRSGITTVILPKRNEPDIMEDIPKELREKMTFVFANEIRDVLAAALEPASEPVTVDEESENGLTERAKRRKVEKAVAKGQ